MTNEELERAIDFLLKSQANLEAQGARTDERVSRLAEQVSQLSGTVDQLSSTVNQLSGTVDQLSGTVDQLTGQLSSFADTQANIMRVMTQTFEAQSRINESVRASLVELAGRQSRTEETMARLAESQASSERRLEALIRIVEEGRRGQH